MLKRIVALSLILLSAPAFSQEPPKIPEVKAEQHPESRLKPEIDTKADKRTPAPSPTPIPEVLPSSEDRKCETQCKNTEQEGTEFWPPLAGYRFKVTDTLLVIFTALLFFATVALWWSTRRLVKGAEETARKQLRAYVLVKTTTFRRPETEDGDNRHWPIHLVFQNSGQTPAYSVTIRAERCLGQQRPIDSIFPFSEAAEISPPSIIAPGGRHTMQLGGLEPGHAGYLAAQRAGKYCYVWGRLDYVDTFGRKHFTKFQMWQGFYQGINQFGFCQVGNSTDDEFPEG
jgi:hypothetical protein